jgi:hypothetical protein
VCGVGQGKHDQQRRAQKASSGLHDGDEDGWCWCWLRQ